jgi:hypothetical protein
LFAHFARVRNFAINCCYRAENLPHILGGSGRYFTGSHEGRRMPKARGLLNHVTIEVASRERICHRHKAGRNAHVIRAGEKCLVIDTPVMGKQSYCLEAAAGMVEQAESDLETLRIQVL